MCFPVEVGVPEQRHHLNHDDAEVKRNQIEVDQLNRRPNRQIRRVDTADVLQINS